MPHVEVPSAEFKVVLLGDTNTGKTCLVLRFVDGSYKPAIRSSTIGAFFLTKRLTVNNITCKVLIWDTAGQEKFQKLTVTYYQNAAAAIICYDVSNPNGLQRLRKNLEELEVYKQNKPMVLVVAACKTDLMAVPNMEADAQKLAATYGAMYMETSAKTNHGVNELFLSTAARVLEWHEAAVHGQARPLPVTVGGSSSSLRLSPTSNATSNSPHQKLSTGFQPSPRGGDGGDADNNVTAKSATTNNNNDHDSCTENESDEVMEEPEGPQTKSNGGTVTCEGSYLVCGVEDPGRTCVIL
eukprot:scaffold1690_cov182-Amphora_coffeaeformis.AAC.17